MRLGEYESDFQADLTKDLEAEGYVVLKIDPGTGTVPKGWPDLEILQPGGTTMRCEVKAIDGEVTPQQRRHMHLLTLGGHLTCFCDERPEYCWPRHMTPKEIQEYEPPKSRGTTG